MSNFVQVRESGNQQNKIEYNSREYIYSHIIVDIERNLKPKNRQKVSAWLKERILYHFKTLEIINKREQFV